MSESDRRPDDGPGLRESTAGDTAEMERELERLRAETAELRARLAKAEAKAGAEAKAEAPVRAARPALLLVRQAIAAVLITLAAFGVVASVIGIWGARTTLDTDRWVATVAPLPRNPEVNAAVATYLTDEIFKRLNAQQRVAEALPPKAAFLAAPTTDAVRNYLRGRIQNFMATEQFQTLWNNASRTAHNAILAVLEGRSEVVSAGNDTVTLNLLPIVNNALVRIESELPTLFGRQLDLPALSSGEIPPGLRARIEKALGVSLPADFAQITLYDRDELGQLQQAVLVFKRSVVLLVTGTLVLFALALAISPRRRRTLLQFGVALAVFVTVMSAVLRAVRDQLLAQVPEGVYQQGASVAMHEVFTTLRVRGDQLLWIGVAIAVLAYLVGPGRLPVVLRRYTVSGAREAARAARRVGTSDELRRWAAHNLDPLRIGGVVAAVLVALLFSSWTAFLVIVLLLAGYEVLVTLLARWGGLSATRSP
ncbi:hypothetical protein [Actinomadura sp. 6N118]|uniref:hypothetical protein n=1 Tax=Actinomadura sp. 6N118 TaxID=3375151 RepID=UPI00379EDC9C